MSTVTSPASPRATAVRTPVSPTMTLVAALLGFFLIILDASAVNVGLPGIGRDLGGGMSGLQWVVDGYTLVFAALMLSAGALSDRIGASRAFGAGLAAFTLSSVACGLAPGLGMLIGARVAQGASAALLLPASLALIRQAYEQPAKRAQAIAIWTAGGAVAIAAGPVVGGLLTSAWSWRGIFLINVPVGILAVALLTRVPRSARRPASLDLTGQFTAVTTLVALTFTVIEGGHVGYGAPEVLTALVVTVVAGTAFLITEARAAQPMVPLGLFRSRTVSIAITTGFALNAAYYGIVFLLSLYFQQVRGYSPVRAGLMFVPMTLFIAAANLAAPRLTARFGPRLPIVVGQLMMVLGLLGLLALGESTPAVAMAALTVPVGLGAALAVPTLTTVLLESVEPERAGLAAGVFNAGRQVGGGLAVALFGSLVAGPASFHAGMARSLLVGAVLLLAAATASLTLRTPAGPSH